MSYRNYKYLHTAPFPGIDGVPESIENFGTSAADLLQALAIVGLIGLALALLVWFRRKSQASRLSQCFDSIAINSKDRSSGCLR